MLHEERALLDIGEDRLQIVEGGRAGICIIPTEWDKVQILTEFSDEGVDLYYFGDKHTPTGNDHRLLSHPRVRGYPVRDPDHTLSILQGAIAPLPPPGGFAPLPPPNSPQGAIAPLPPPNSPQGAIAPPGTSLQPV